MFRSFERVHSLLAFFDGYINPVKRNEPSFEDILRAIIGAMIVGFIVYTVPVLIYRFAIRNGEPIPKKSKAALVNTAFFAVGVIVVVLINALAGSYEDENYHFSLGLMDAIFWFLDFFILIFEKKEEKTLSAPPSSPKTTAQNTTTTNYVRTCPPSNKSENQSSGSTAATSTSYIPIRKVTPPSTPPPELKDITQLYDEYMDSLIKPVLSLETGSIAPQNGDPTDWKFELSVLLYMLADCALFGQPTREKDSTRLWEHIQLKYNVTLNDREYDFWSRVEIYATLINGRKARCDWMMADPSFLQKADIPAKLIYAFGDFLINPECRNDYENAPIVLHGFDHIMEFSVKFRSTVSIIVQAASDFFVTCKKNLNDKQAPPVQSEPMDSVEESRVWVDSIGNIVPDTNKQDKQSSWGTNEIVLIVLVSLMVFIIVFSVTYSLGRL